MNECRQFRTSFGFERRFPAVELFSAIFVVVAGHDQGGLYGPCDHHFGIRPENLVAKHGDEPAFSYCAKGICAAKAQPRLYPF